MRKYLESIDLVATTRFIVFKEEEMKKCKLCGQAFDVVETQKDFEYITGLSYMKIKPDLCFRCAAEAVEIKTKGVYF